ncbi:MAG TPA: ABC transporter ATP-binding protein [Xanthobacteraceae bacterium]|jgi:ATP-binding cassette subfamily B protein
MLQSFIPPSATDPGSTLGVIRRLVVEFGLGQWRRYALAFALMGVAAACTAIPVYLIGNLVNLANVDHNFPGVVALGLGAACIYAIKGAATYGQTVILSRIANHIIAENQRRLFSKLLDESIGFFANRHSSEFAARLVAGAAAATQVLNLLITSIGRDLFSLIGLVGVMVLQDPLLSIGTLIVCPPAMLMLRKMVKRIRGIARTQFTGGTRILETLQETLQGIRIVKAFTLEDVLRTRFDANVAAVEREANKMARVANRTSPMMEILGGFAIAGAVIYGGHRVIENAASAGALFSFITAFLLAIEPAKRLARFNIDLTSNLVAVHILFEIIDSPATEPADDDRPQLALKDARVEFSRVHFAYRAGDPVLRDLSFVAEPARVTALVGHSGGGKSTILNLIPRFYEVTSGVIAIDGQNVATVSRKSLRRQIAYVGQDVFLFHGTIRDNIAYGKLGASEAEIKAAAAAAHAHDFIMGFPAGYDTPVGERGLQLSGGERQRISIARALVRNAPIILLDEATAALDSESERHVQDAIAKLCLGRTTIVIAHRLATVMHADRILVIESGQIVETGRHDDLLRAGGLYASFCRLQLEQREQPENPIFIEVS